MLDVSNEFGLSPIKNWGILMVCFPLVKEHGQRENQQEEKRMRRRRIRKEDEDKAVQRKRLV
jgi:hypothetical protein